MMFRMSTGPGPVRRRYFRPVTRDEDDDTERQPDIRCLDRRTVYENPWMTLTEDIVERGDGSTGIYGVVRSRDFSLIMPFDGVHFHLVEQYRYPVEQRLWEFPQGAVVDPPGLTPREAAAVELQEEAGLVADTWTHLGFLHAGYGRSSSGFDVFLATDLSPVPTSREIEEQDMRCGTFTEDEVWQLISRGLMTDSQSVAALALLDRYMGRVAH